MTSPSILFVDDEEGILSGVRRAVRRQYRDWTVHCALGGKAGLEILRSEHVDIVVSDMRMPEMDGAAFLENVKEIAPQTIRFVLSGEAERDITLRTLRVSHQFFAKPVDTDRLTAKAASLIARRDAVKDQDFLRAVLGVDTIYDPRFAQSDADSLLRAFDEDAKGAIDRLETSCATATKLIQLANSAYFGIGPAVVRAADGAARLGGDLVKDLLENGYLFARPLQGQASPSSDRLGPPLAAMAKTIARNMKCTEEDEMLLFSAAHFVDAAGLIYVPLAQARDAAPKCIDLIDGAAFFAELWGAENEVVSAISNARALGGDTSSNIMRVVAASALPLSASPADDALKDSVLDGGQTTEELDAIIAEYSTARAAGREAA